MKTIYQRAKERGCYLEATCVSSTQREWDNFMKGARPANTKKVERIAEFAGLISKEDRKYYNPYNHYVTKTHIIYVHSGIEHFIRVQ